MTPEARAALEESIAHWERLATGTSAPAEEIGPRDCALCALFFWPDCCLGCPVAEATGWKNCRGTPWGDVKTARDDHGYDSREFREAAERELEFLRGLLLEHLTDAELDEVIAKEARGG